MNIIKRTFKLLWILKYKRQMSLKEIAQNLEIPNNSAWNLLNALVKERIVEKVANGRYSLSDTFNELCSARPDKMTLRQICRKYIQELSNDINETVIATVLEGYNHIIIAEAMYTGHGIVVNPVIFREGSLFKWATGRILLSYLPSPILDSIIRMNKRHLSDWPEINNSMDKMNQALKMIRNKKMAYLNSQGVTSIAVPIQDKNKAVVLSLGTCLPNFRYKGSNRKTIKELLTQTAKTISDQIIGRNLDPSTDIIKSE